MIWAKSMSARGVTLTEPIQVLEAWKGKSRNQPHQMVPARQASLRRTRPDRIRKHAGHTSHFLFPMPFNQGDHQLCQGGKVTSSLQGQKGSEGVGG